MTFLNPAKLCFEFPHGGDWCWELLWEQNLIGQGKFESFLSGDFGRQIDPINLNDVATKIDHSLSIFFFFLLLQLVGVVHLLYYLLGPR